MTEHLLPDEIEKAAELLKRGEVVAFPTETVYGLGASIFNEEAIRKVFQAKGRPSDNPLIAHIADLNDLSLIAVDIPKIFYRLAEHFFPGPLTVVLPRHPAVPSLVSGGLPTIAVRMPQHPIARKLIQLVGVPLVAPSANLSGRPSATTAQHVLDDLDGRISAVIDGGASLFGLESTVLNLQGETPVILRPGEITRAQLEAILGQKIEECTKIPTADEPVASPGMKYVHYAPKAPVRCFSSKQELSKYLAANPGIKRMLLANEPMLLGNCDYFPLSAQALYAFLRLADVNGYQEIIALCDQAIESNAALMDRLSRASSK